MENIELKNIELHLCNICGQELPEAQMKEIGLCFDCSVNSDCPVCKGYKTLKNNGEVSICLNRNCKATLPSAIFDTPEKPVIYKGEIYNLCKCNSLMSHTDTFCDDNTMYMHFSCNDCRQPLNIELTFKS